MDYVAGEAFCWALLTGLPAAAAEASVSWLFSTSMAELANGAK